MDKNTAFRRAFWRHLAERHPTNPHCDQFLDGYGWHTPRYFVLRANLYVCQRLATASVAVSIRGKDSELHDAVEGRVKPYARLFDEQLGDIRHGNQWYPGFLESRLELYPSSTRDYTNWDRMTDFLEERRKIYARILNSL